MTIQRDADRPAIASQNHLGGGRRVHLAADRFVAAVGEFALGNPDVARDHAQPLAVGDEHVFIEAVLFLEFFHLLLAEAALRLG